MRGNRASRRDRREKPDFPFRASRVAVSFKTAREQMCPSHDLPFDLRGDRRKQCFGWYAEDGLQSERSLEAGPPGEPLIPRHLGATVYAEKKSHLRLGEAAAAPEGAQIAFDLVGHGARARAAAAEGTGIF